MPKYNGSFKALERLGYSLNHSKEYYLKTKSIKSYGGIAVWTTAFVDVKTRAITFEGADTFKDQLLEELKYDRI